MALKTIFIAMILAVLAAIGWRYSRTESFAQWLNPPPKAAPIVFDNGSVRESPSASSSGESVAVHGMRRCQRGSEVTYTDHPCAKGFRELPVKGGVVTVVEAPPKPRVVSGDKAAVDVRAKAIERVVER